jgi:ABC-type uncharacterized transport system permease subunit
MVFMQKENQNSENEPFRIRPFTRSSFLFVSLVVLSLLMGFWLGSRTTLQHWVDWHIIYAYLSGIFLLCGFMMGMIYLRQRRALKSKKFNQVWTFKFFSLETLETLLGVFLWVGFGFLTLALGSGFMTYSQSFEDQHEFFLKIFLSVSLWLWYFLGILFWQRFSLSSRRFAQLGLNGFLLFSILFMGIKYFFGGAKF